MRRFFQAVDKPAEGITSEDVRGYLGLFRDGNRNSYANALKPLKAFFCDFLKAREVVESFKFPRRPQEPIVVPTKEELRRFYDALDRPIAQAMFLIYATSGLRKREVLSFTKDDSIGRGG